MVVDEHGDMIQQEIEASQHPLSLSPKPARKNVSLLYGYTNRTHIATYMRHAQKLLASACSHVRIQKKSMAGRCVSCDNFILYLVLDILYIIYIWLLYAWCALYMLKEEGTQDRTGIEM